MLKGAVGYPTALFSLLMFMSESAVLLLQNKKHKRGYPCGLGIATSVFWLFFKT